MLSSRPLGDVRVILSVSSQIGLRQQINDTISINMTPTQSRMALAALRWTLDDFAMHSGVPRITVARYQSGKQIAAESIEAMKSALENADVEFGKKSSRISVSVPE